MQETSIYHIVTEHPFISFFGSAIIMAILILIVASKIMSYQEKRQNENKEELKRNGKLGTN